MSQTYPALPSPGGLMEQDQNETVFVLVEVVLKTDPVSFLGIHIFLPSLYFFIRSEQILKERRKSVFTLYGMIMTRKKTTKIAPQNMCLSVNTCISTNGMR